MDDAKRLEKIDAVTVGQIRKRCKASLDAEIQTLAAIIREGYHKLPKAEVYLKETIARTLTQLQNIESMASTEINFP